MPKQWRHAVSAWLAAGCLVLAGASALPATIVHAQDNSGSYTVAPGDTLGAIAARFGVTVNALAAANGIADPNLVKVGQVLAIPGSDGAGGTAVAALPSGQAPAPAAVAYSGQTSSVRALPGDSLGTLAQRYKVDPAVVAGMNGADATEGAAVRLFPGEPVRVPVEVAPPASLYFGAVTGVEVPPSIIQGRTGRVMVDTSRPVELTGMWLGQPIVFTPIGDQGRRLFALLPVPALQDPGQYDLVISYTTSRGDPVSRSWKIEVKAGDYDSQQIVVSEDVAAEMKPELINAEKDKLVGLWSQVSPQLLWTGPFQRPIDPQYPTTSPFGTRRDYSVADMGNFHAGQDFGAPEGALIKAPAPGVVVMAERVTVRGNAVVVDHGRGIFTGYWHMSEIRVRPGQQVATGDVLGVVGNTGLSTGAHLHWEMRINGVAVDPMQFLDEGPYPAQ